MIFILLGCLNSAEKNHLENLHENQESTGCFATVPGEDEPHVIVYSSPYHEDGTQSTTWNAGVFNETDQSIDSFGQFEMGRKTFGRLVFTPDGRYGFVAQQDGSIGQFRIDQQAIDVVEDGLTGEWYAQDVWFDSASGKLWIVDPNWPENGGGIYQAPVDCQTGQVGSASLVLPTKNAFGVFPVDSERLLLLAREAFDSTHQVFMIHRESLELIDSTIAFLHADYNLSAVGISNSHLFVGDNSTFSDTPNGFVAIELTADGFASREFVEVLDPVSLVSSMDGAVLLVSSGYGDALFQYLPRIGTFTSLSTSAPSALPGVGSRVARGSWKGSVLVPENLAIRLVSFAADSAKDEGLVYEAEGLSGIIGSVGISP